MQEQKGKASWRRRAWKDLEGKWYLERQREEGNKEECLKKDLVICPGTQKTGPT